MNGYARSRLLICSLCVFVFAAGCGQTQNSNEVLAENPMEILENIRRGGSAAADDKPALVRKTIEAAEETISGENISAKNISKTPSPKKSTAAQAAKKKVDIDLTTLSATMLYAQVQNMMMNPTEYLGKTVRASGAYSVWCFAGTDECHHFVAIADAAACCETGLEFQWKGTPGRYPPELSMIEIAGVFSNYEKFERTLYYIAIDGITVLKK